MTVISKKLLQEKLSSNVRCTHLHAAVAQSCMKFQLILCRQMAINSVKFLFPLTTVQVLLKYRNSTGPLYQQILKTLSRRLTFALFYGTFAFSSVCISNKIFPRMHYLLFGFSNGCLAGLSSVVGTRNERVMDTIFSVSMVLESLFKGVKHFDLFSVTTKKLTVIFMLNNALLMYLFSIRNKEKKNNFIWFFTPPQKNKKLEVECYHKNSCMKYCFEGMAKYFIIGSVWNIVKNIFSLKMKIIRQPSSLITVLGGKSNVLLGTFLGSYVGIYRLISCYFPCNRNIKFSYHPLIAGLLSGLSFGIQPNIQILCLGITTTLQFLYERVEDKYIFLKKIPTLLSLFAFCQGLLLHERILAPDICPKYFYNLTSMLSGGELDKMCKDFWSHFV